ncbi:cation diffusion facilitator family transporter [Thioalbus denitrificans]|uniref:Cation-efflux pump FieF n=1 Tax=Thioalbus denitrificans TaxID=547122 RepID=A0A369BW54_9GAMM|nr:cation diffusion facilitator family transporter [Thioalbus denitrificans]RCX24958.1 ferrous-iron efflux pump FieF [Thioalbus denitrificans]
MNAPAGLDRQARLLRRATLASVVTASVLIAAKLVAWLLTGSVSLLASLVDSLMDVAASIINLMAVRYALEPPDAQHRFGHGKSEALAGLAQATFIAGSAVFLVFHAVDRLLHPVPLADLEVGIVVMVFAIVATAVLVAIQRHAIRHTGSTAIRADSLHYLTDLLTNVGIIAALVLAGLGWQGIDPVIAIVIAVYIFWSAWGIGREAFHVLMDRELPEAVRERVTALALGHPEVRGVHDLRTRQSGLVKIIQLHLELDAWLPLREAHAMAKQVEREILAAYPEADVTIHQDPREVDGSRSRS